MAETLGKQKAPYQLGNRGLARILGVSCTLYTIYNAYVYYVYG